MRRFPTQLFCLTLLSFTSLACLGGGCPLFDDGSGTPTGPTYEPTTGGLSLYAPDRVGLDEPFSIQVTARNDPVYGASNPDVTIRTDNPKITPGIRTFPVHYAGNPPADSRTIEMTNEMEASGLVDIVAQRQAPGGGTGVAKHQLAVVAFRTQLQRPEEFSILPGETKTVDAILTVDAFRAGTASIMPQPVAGYTITPSPATVNVPIGHSTHSVRLNIVASSSAVNSGTDLNVVTSPATAEGLQTHVFLPLRGPTESSITLQVSPSEMELHPNQLAPETTLTVRGHGTGGIILVDVEDTIYLERTPSANPLGFNIPISGVGTQKFRWLWDGFTGTPESKIITYTADVDGKRYTATQFLTFRWGE